VKRSLIIIVSVVAAASLAVGASAARHSAAAAAMVSTGGSSLGRILVNGKGLTLYLFEKDRRGRSACSGTCAAYWPPLLTRGKPTAKNGAKAGRTRIPSERGGTCSHRPARKSNPVSPARIREPRRPACPATATPHDDPCHFRKPAARLGQQRRPSCRRHGGGTRGDRTHDQRRSARAASLRSRPRRRASGNGAALPDRV
jgi:Secreted repeat of unknown function